MHPHPTSRSTTARHRGIALLVAGLLLAACAGDDPVAAPTAEQSSGTAAADGTTVDEPDQGATVDADEALDDQEPNDPDDEPSSVLVQFRGASLVADGDDEFFSCLTMGGDELVSFGFIDGAGNDVSVAYEEGSATAVIALADGTTWNQSEDGVVNAMTGPDGTVRLSVQMTEIDTGQTESADIRVDC